MTTPKFDLATELLKGGLPRMAQAIASLYRELRTCNPGRLHGESVWLASLSAATPPANVEQPATALAELRQVEGATGANAESWDGLPTGPDPNDDFEKISSELAACNRLLCVDVTELETKLSASEARVRELEETLGDSSESSDATSDVHVFPAGTTEAMRDARLRREIFDCVKQHPTKPKIATWQYGKALRLISDYRHELSRELYDTKAQLLAEQDRGFGLENALSAMTDRKRMLDQREASLLDDVREAERTIAGLENELAWEKAWDLRRKHATSAVVEVFAKFDDVRRAMIAEDHPELFAALSALDASSKPDAPAMVLGGFGAPGYGMQPAPIAEPEPAGRPIVVGSTWRDKRSGHLVKVDMCKSGRVVSWIDGGGYSETWDSALFLVKHERQAERARRRGIPRLRSVAKRDGSAFQASARVGGLARSRARPSRWGGGVKRRDKSLVAEAVIESVRCRRAVEAGSPRDFWHMRLSRRLAEIDDARTVLKCALESLATAQASKPGKP